MNFAVTFLREDGSEVPDTPIAEIVRHVDYLAERMGIDHVAFGSDFDGALMPEELDGHRILAIGGNAPRYLRTAMWLTEVARNGKGPRVPAFLTNNVIGLLRGCQRGIGVAMLPDYLVEENHGLVQLFGGVVDVASDAYFVYPEELKSVARIQVFRDFLVSKAQRWSF